NVQRRILSRAPRLVLSAAYRSTAGFSEKTGTRRSPIGASRRRKPQPVGQSTTWSNSVLTGTPASASVVPDAARSVNGTTSLPVSAPAWRRHFSGTARRVHSPRGSSASASPSATSPPQPSPQLAPSVALALAGNASTRSSSTTGTSPLVSRDTSTGW